MRHRHKHTSTKDHHIDTNDNGAHGNGEELANTAQHHNHADRDVHEATVDMISATLQRRTVSSARRPDQVTRTDETYKMLEKSIVKVLLVGFHLINRVWVVRGLGSTSPRSVDCR